MTFPEWPLANDHGRRRSRKTNWGHLSNYPPGSSRNKRCLQTQPVAQVQ
jgi:hypothetical protein